MRLLNAKTQKLESFFDDMIPRYAILSHTWGKDEVTFHDIHPHDCPWHMPASDEDVARILKAFEAKYKAKAGYVKIDGCCRQALQDEIEWVWIDTCCIDKSSSAELQEAINSMFAWYKNAAVCYAFLSDVTATDETFGNSKLLKSRWFTRGWTLQELIAPREVTFFDAKWTLLTKKSWSLKFLAQHTGVPEGVLKMSSSCLDEPVGQRMAWAAGRKTTRKEDEAYCLLGIFGINMPMLYGEGHNAFARLVKEIIARYVDQTTIAFGYRIQCADSYPDLDMRQYFRSPLSGLPKSPYEYTHCSNLNEIRGARETEPFTLTAKGMHVFLPILSGGYSGGFPQALNQIAFCILDITELELDFGGNQWCLAIPVHKQDVDSVYGRVPMELPIFVPKSVRDRIPSQSICIGLGNEEIISCQAYFKGSWALRSLKLPPGYFLAGTSPIQLEPAICLYFLPEPGGKKSKALQFLLHIANVMEYGVLVVFSIPNNSKLELLPEIKAAYVSEQYCVMNRVEAWNPDSFVSPLVVGEHRGTGPPDTVVVRLGHPDDDDPEMGEEVTVRVTGILEDDRVHIDICLEALRPRKDLDSYMEI